MLYRIYQNMLYTEYQNIFIYAIQNYTDIPCSISLYRLCNVCKRYTEYISYNAENISQYDMQYIQYPYKEYAIFVSSDSRIYKTYNIRK